MTYIQTIFSLLGLIVTVMYSQDLQGLTHTRTDFHRFLLFISPQGSDPKISCRDETSHARGSQSCEKCNLGVHK